MAKARMSYVLFDEDCETILGVYSTPTKAQKARETREKQLGYTSDVRDSLYIAWVPMDKDPDPDCDQG